MSLFTKIMRWIIRILDGLVSLIALVMIVSAMLLAAYSLWDANQIYHAADAAEYEAYIPREEDFHSFEELQGKNPEVIGWLRVNDTTINYPLVQAQDNSKYVNTDVEGNYSLSGAIFLNCLNKPNFTDFNNIIYGHHMAENKMFGNIGLFTDREYFEDHPYGNLFFEGKDHGIEFFAMLTIDAYDELFLVREEEEKSKQDYLDYLYQKARYVRDMDVTAKDRLVLLTTCTTSMTNGRNILVGRLSDTIYPEAETPRNDGTGVDQLIHKMPIWIWILLAAMLLMLIHRLRLKKRQRKRKKKRERES